MDTEGLLACQLHTLLFIDCMNSFEKALGLLAPQGEEKPDPTSLSSPYLRGGSQDTSTHQTSALGLCHCTALSNFSPSVLC